MEWALIILGSLLMLVGLIGVFVPIVPDLPTIWVGIFLLALATDFQNLEWGILGLLLAMAFSTFLIDATGQLIGAKTFGASKKGILGSVFGLLVGFSLGLPGMLLGPLIGAIVFELIGGRSRHEAFRAGIGVFFGFLGGMVIKFVLALTMIGLTLQRVL